MTNPPGTLPGISVVTIGWRNERFGHGFVTSLARAAERAGRRAPELVVVVNGPEGEAAGESVVHGSAGTPLAPVLVTLGANTGFSGGANAGVGRATGEILVVANLDLTFAEGFLEALNRYALDPAWDFLAPRVLQGEAGEETGVSRRRRSHTLAWVTPPPHAGAVPAGNGSCLVFRRATLNRRLAATGELFDAECHSFNEDIDLFWWAARIGLVVRYAPGLEVKHALAGSFGGDYRFGARPREVQRRVMANYRVTVWKNARSLGEWLGWPMGEARYLAQAIASRGLGGMALYAASWPDALAVARAIRRRRGTLRPAGSSER